MFVVDDAAAAIRDYASQGYNLVIAHGSQYGSSLQEIAPDFPNTSFAWGTTVDTFGKGITNIYAYEARSEEGGYVNGVMAGKLSKSVIGVVGPIETGDAKLYVDGFVAGGTKSATRTSPPTQLHRLLQRRRPGDRSGQYASRRGRGCPDRHGSDGCRRDRRGRSQECPLVRHAVEPDLAGPVVSSPIRSMTGPVRFWR